MKRDCRSTSMEEITSVISSKNSDLIKSFLRVFDLGYEDSKLQAVIDEKELNDFKSAFDILEFEDSMTQGWFIGTKLPNIAKQFDLLRFTNQQVLSIEVKGQLPKTGLDGVKAQLQENSNYLHYLDYEPKNVIVIEIIISENKIYQVSNDNLQEISIDYLKSKIINAEPLPQNPVMSIDGSAFLLSPINDVDKFIDGKYFLNSHQDQVKKEILSSNGNFVITGGPGTGKTLVIYDLAKTFQEDGNSVIIVLSGQKTLNHEQFSSKTDIPIISVKDFTEDDFGDTDVIIVDEAQRLYEESLNRIKDTTARKIFAGDERQVFHKSEQKRAIIKTVIEDGWGQFELKDKLRSNPEMNEAIKRILNQKAKGSGPIEFDDVFVQYFESDERAQAFLNKQANMRGSAIIEFTPYTTKTSGKVKCTPHFGNSKNVHEVIGQEFENVVVILDDNAYYDEDRKLAFLNPEFYPHLKAEQFYEAMTRVRNSLTIVVIDNPDMFIQMQRLLSWKDDSSYEGGKR